MIFSFAEQSHKSEVAFFFRCVTMARVIFPSYFLSLSHFLTHSPRNQTESTHKKYNFLHIKSKAKEKRRKKNARKEGKEWKNERKKQNGKW